MNENYKKIGIFFGLAFILILFSNPLVVPIRAGIDYSQQQSIIDYSRQQSSSSPIDILLSYLEPGDIIFMDNLLIKEYIKNFPDEGIYSNDHCTMFVRTNPDDEDNHTDWCIHAGDPVKYSRFCSNDNIVINHTNFTIYRVNATLEQKTKAINWTRNRIGCNFQNIFFGRIRKDWDVVANPSPLSLKNKFYCSELIWAAYYNTSGGAIDIDYNGNGMEPYGIPCVNMGFPLFIPDWIQNIIKNILPSNYYYAIQNEIKKDDDIELIYPLYSMQFHVR